MTFNYAATAATVKRLLERFGASTTLKKIVSGYSPATGTAPEIEDAVAVTAAVFAYDQEYIDGTLIRMGDMRAYLTAAEEPTQGDKLTWQGKDWEVVAVKPLAPAGIAVMYEAQIRG